MTQETSDFERHACEEMDDVSLSSSLWYKVREDDPLSVEVEEKESVGLEGRSIDRKLVSEQNEKGVESEGSEWSWVAMVEFMASSRYAPTFTYSF